MKTGLYFDTRGALQQDPTAVSSAPYLGNIFVCNTIFTYNYFNSGCSGRSLEKEKEAVRKTRWSLKNSPSSVIAPIAEELRNTEESEASEEFKKGIESSESERDESGNETRLILTVEIM